MGGVADGRATSRFGEIGLLALASCLSLWTAHGARWAAGAAGNDLLFHGQLVEACLRELRAGRFFEALAPWSPEVAGGGPVLLYYPGLSHLLTAIGAWLWGGTGWAALGVGAAAATAVFPWACWLGARLAGLGRPAAALAAFVAASMHSVDPLGAQLSNMGAYGTGLYAQMWGATLAWPALGAWVAAIRRDGAGLPHQAAAWRVVLAALLLSLVVRLHLPAGWVLGCVAACLLVQERPFRPALGRALAVGALAVALAAPFLAGFVGALPAVYTLRPAPMTSVTSVGAAEVLSRLVAGRLFDEGGIAVWTPLLLVAVPFLLGPASRFRTDPARPFAAAMVPCLLLLFGRYTWGSWIDRVPMVRNFDDARYLLGLQWLGPWVIAAFVVGALRQRPAWPRWAPGAALAAGLGVVLAASFRSATDLWADGQAMAAADAQLATVRTGWQDLAADLRQPGERAALWSEDRVTGRTTLRAWLGSQGVATLADPVHSYGPNRDFASYWDRRVAGRGTPPNARTLQWAGITQVIDEGPPVAVVAQRPPGPSLWRADALLQAERMDPAGADLAAFLLGLPGRGQAPILDPGTGPSPDPRQFLQVHHTELPDPKRLGTLLPAGELGTVTSWEVGIGPADRIVRLRIVDDGVWLNFDVGWFPALQATLDGKAVPHYLMLPGWAAVPVPVGDHEVRLRWTVPAWRGPSSLVAALGFVALTLWLIGPVPFRRLRPGR